MRISVSKKNQARVLQVRLWFDDRNIIFTAEDTLFKVHMGMLSKKSEIFRGMFPCPQMENLDDLESPDGIGPVVHMSDNWKP